jgi:hypothetical protein
VVSPRCRWRHRFVSGNGRVHSQTGWRGLPSLGRCPWAVCEVRMATGPPPRLLRAAQRPTRSAGWVWTAPSSEPIGSFRHVATDAAAPRVHAGVVHARPWHPQRGRWRASTASGGVGPRRTTEPNSHLLSHGGDEGPGARSGRRQPAWWTVACRTDLIPAIGTSAEDPWLRSDARREGRHRPRAGREPGEQTAGRRATRDHGARVAPDRSACSRAT